MRPDRLLRAVGPRREIDPQITYLLFATPRSGSYLLCEGLTGSGHAGRPTEYWGPHMIGSLWEQWRPGSWDEYAERLQTTFSTPNGAFGAKVTWRHFTRLVEALGTRPGAGHRHAAQVVARRWPTIRYVWIQRDDKVSQAVSFARAMQSGVWSRHGPAHESERAVRYDAEQISRLLRRIQRDEELIATYLDAAGAAAHVVKYERLVARFDQTVWDVLDHLRGGGAGGKLPPRRLQPQADDITREWVERFTQAATAREG